MALKVEKALIPRHFVKGNNRAIEYIVIHYFGSLGTAKAVANYFAATDVEASAHYCLDEGDVVYQCVEDGDIAWHCGTKGAYAHPRCRNSNSIGIEVRPRKLDPATAASAAVRDWYFEEDVTENLVEFTKTLMEKYDIPVERVVRHYDVTGKWCPRPWMGDDVNEYYGTSGNEQWEKFLARLTEKESPEAPAVPETPAAPPAREETSQTREEEAVRYERLSDIPESCDFRAIIDQLMTAGILGGDGSDPGGNGDVIDLSHDMVRMIVLNYRAGVYDRVLEEAGFDPQQYK